MVECGSKRQSVHQIMDSVTENDHPPNCLDPSSVTVAVTLEEAETTTHCVAWALWAYIDLVKKVGIEVTTKCFYRLYFHC